MPDRIAYLDPVDGGPLEACDQGLRNARTGTMYPVIRGIPRFVEHGNYTDNFGDQWNAFRETQLDSRTGLSISRERLYRGTEWNPCELQGKTVLEIGCGAGRFTEHLLADGAEVWSIDYSTAVEACLTNCGDNDRLHVAQADLRQLPFAVGVFDYVLMYGVMPLTPSPRKSLETAVRMAKSGGRIGVDTYVKMRACRWTSKYLWRWLTTRISPRNLRRFIAWYVPRWLRVDNSLRWRVPRLHRFMSCVVPCWNYRGILKLTDEQFVEWAILDTYDALGSRYDKPCTRAELVGWLNEMPGIEFSVKPGSTGLVANILKL